jgi:hypothetical protein
VCGRGMVEVDGGVSQVPGSGSRLELPRLMDPWMWGLSSGARLKPSGVSGTNRGPELPYCSVRNLVMVVSCNGHGINSWILDIHLSSTRYSLPTSTPS